METQVGPGDTYVLKGLLSAGDVLLGEAGTKATPAGALLKVRSSATNNGTIALAGGPSDSGAFGQTGAVLRNFGTLTNNGLIALAGGDFAAPGGGPVTGAQLVNQGTLLNAGTVLVGGAKDGGSGTQTGSGALLRDNGVLTNTGLVLVAGEPSYAAGSAGGTVAVNGILNNAGTLELQGATRPMFYEPMGAGAVLKVLATGTLANSGVLRIDSSGPGFSAAGGTLLDRGVLLNTGTILLGQNDGYGLYAGAALLMVAAGGTLDTAGLLNVGGRDYQTPGTFGLVDAGVLTNSGVLNLSAVAGGAGLEVTGSLSNSGALNLDGGSAPQYDGSGGSLGATLFNTGVLTNAGTLSIAAGAPTVSRVGPGGPAYLLDQGTLTNTGALLIQGGGLSRYGYGGGYGDSLGGKLAVTGVLNNEGTLAAAGGAIQGDYRRGFGTESRGSIEVSGTLTNAGLLELQGGYRNGAQLIDSGVVVNTGTLAIGASRYGDPYGVPASVTITTTGTLTNSGMIVGGGTIVNYGVMNATGATGAIAPALLNDGTVRLGSNAALSLDGPTTASTGRAGVFDLSAHSVLTIDGAVGRGEQVMFIGSNATLALGDARDFAATLRDLGAQTTIDFLKLDVTGVSASASALLVTLAGGDTLDLALAAPLPDQAMLRLGSDGHGGTDLHIGSASGSALAASIMASPHGVS